MFKLANARERRILSKDFASPFEAAFWTPHSNLLVRTKKTPTDHEQKLIFKTLTLLCDGANNFCLINRPPLSLLKINGLATTDPSGHALNLDMLLMELFDDQWLRDATFWHAPRFVTYKGAPLGRFGTLFFSLVDDSRFSLGNSLIGSNTSIFGHSFTIEKRHPQRHMALPPSSIYKE